MSQLACIQTSSAGEDQGGAKSSGRTKGPWPSSGKISYAHELPTWAPNVSCKSNDQMDKGIIRTESKKTPYDPMDTK